MAHFPQSQYFQGFAGFLFLKIHFIFYTKIDIFIHLGGG